MRDLWSPASLAHRFLAGWWRGLTHDGSYVLSMYVALHPALWDDRPGDTAGHPERLVSDQPLSPGERRLWAQLTDLAEISDE